jgi:hypothetical protein
MVMIINNEGCCYLELSVFAFADDPDGFEDEGVNTLTTELYRYELSAPTCITL